MNHRQHVGPAGLFDVLGAHQFCTLVAQGLREKHYLLDVGCGSLRAGRLLIPYLDVGHYHGIEPEEDVLRAGMFSEPGIANLVAARDAKFSYNRDFDCTAFFVGRFDYILAHSILTHTGLDMAAVFWQQVARVLAPDGMVLATMNVGPRDSKNRGWVYPGCLAHTLDTMKMLAAQAGLFLESLEQKTPRNQTWLKATRRD